MLAVPAIGFTAIYAVLRFPNFTVASHATIGAFAGYVVNTAVRLAGLARRWSWPSWWPAPPAWSTTSVVLQPAAARPARSPTAIAAVALTIVLENVVRFIFGNDLRGYDLPLRRDWQWGRLRIGPQQVENLVIAVVAMAAVFLFLGLHAHGQGHARRRRRPHPGQHQGHRRRARGPPRRTSAAWAWPASAACCSASTPASIPSPASASSSPSSPPPWSAASARIPGAVVGALTIGVAEELSLLSLAPAYRTAVGFVAILLVLTLRPRGLLGERAF